MNNYVLNGSNIESLDSLYSEFAKAVDAPDGYFGMCFQSFDDCLFGGFGLESPCVVIWENSDHSRKAMDSKALENYCLSIIENTNSQNTVGSEEGRKWLYTTLAAAREKKKTLFDEVVETIKSVPKRAGWEWNIELQLK